MASGSNVGKAAQQCLDEQKCHPLQWTAIEAWRATLPDRRCALNIVVAKTDRPSRVTIYI
jgi:hypothetical protein